MISTIIHMWYHRNTDGGLYWEGLVGSIQAKQSQTFWDSQNMAKKAIIFREN